MGVAACDGPGSLSLRALMPVLWEGVPPRLELRFHGSDTNRLRERRTGEACLWLSGLKGPTSGVSLLLDNRPDPDFNRKV